ncbi:hypothetical protein ACUY2A_08600 [Corynebacterium pilbarense]
MRTSQQLATIAVTLTALSVAACSADSSSEPASDASAEEVTVAEETTSEADTSSSEQATSSSSASSSASTSSASDAEDYNDYDGIKTKDFFGALEMVEGMEAAEVEADPKNLRASAELYNEDQSLRADVYIFMPQPDGRPTPVTSHSDQFMKDMHANDLEAFKEESESVTEREISTKNVEWKCIDGAGTQDDGKIDHAVCLAPFAGRVVDAQRLVLHEERDQDDKQLEVVLEKIDAALSTLK